MQISLREFELFVATMELGTLTSAANALAMSQPAASKLLRNLEGRLGLPLFRRQNKKLLPTPEAFDLYPGFLQALAAMEAVKRNAANLRDGHDGQIHIVTNPVVASNLLPEALREFRARYPNISLIVRTRTTMEISELIAKNRADIGVIYEATVDQSLDVEYVNEDDVGCLMPEGHALAALEQVELADLKAYDIIALGKTQPVGAALRRIMSETGIELPISIEVSQSNTACSFVKAGLGVAVLDEAGLREGRERGLVSRRLHPSATVKLSLVRSVNRKGSRYLNELADCIRRACRKSKESSGGALR
ncbi:LysR family transcriptional regulator [Neorhizobium sp. LjRoot104]|uniref:LysR family transcriptional regulator n=1 Tax=Neorhizobium sp. LjRoot104 TaxID=3342254 RepID=UPI003ECF33C8